MTALDLVDWPAWKRIATGFLRLHPRVQVRDLAWGERIVHPGAKEAYAVATFGDTAQVRAVGGQPCGRCGLWTAAWCEGCQHPRPRAICARCDHEHLLCEQCVAEGKIWKECNDANNADEETLEVTGFYDDAGAWISVEPPLRIPLAEVPDTHGDGTFDMEFLATSITEHRQQVGAQTQGDFGGTS